MAVLFALTSRETFAGTANPTGVWFEEFLAPYYYLKDANVEVAIASPKGGEAPIDPASIEALKDNPLYSRFRQDAELIQSLKSTLVLSEVQDKDVDAVIYPGGYGPMFDLRYDESSQRLIKELVGVGKPVATICHAGCVLLDVKGQDGAPLVSGRNLTCFTDSEEIEVSMQDQVPYLVETELLKQGAKFSKAENWGDHCVIDGVLITGQNPASSISVAKAVLKHLGGK